MSENVYHATLDRKKKKKKKETHTNMTDGSLLFIHNNNFVRSSMHSSKLNGSSIQSSAGSTHNIFFLSFLIHTTTSTITIFSYDYVPARQYVFLFPSKKNCCYCCVWMKRKMFSFLLHSVELCYVVRYYRCIWWSVRLKYTNIRNPTTTTTKSTWVLR